MVVQPLHGLDDLVVVRPMHGLDDLVVVRPMHGLVASVTQLNKGSGMSSISYCESLERTGYINSPGHTYRFEELLIPSTFIILHSPVTM